MRGSQWRPLDPTGRAVTGILVIAALAFAAYVYRFDPDVLNRHDGLDQAKVDPRPPISSEINRMLGTQVATSGSQQ
jgi:hypothetical protein